VWKREHVTDLVQRFFQQTLAEKDSIRRKSVEFLPQPVRGHNSAGTPELGFTKHKREDRDVQVQRSDTEEASLRGLRIHREIHPPKNV
jgi:hypothetical protein